MNYYHEFFILFIYAIGAFLGWVYMSIIY